MLETMYVKCAQCGYDNSPEYRFCGMCGTSLAQAKPAEVPSPTQQRMQISEEQRAAEESAGPVSGPSFLGLTDSPESDPSSYLLEDDQPRGRGGLLVFCLFAIAIFAGIGYLEWRTIQNGRLSIPFISKPAAEQPAKTTAPAPQQNSSLTATQQANPQAGNTESNTDSLATSDNDNTNRPVNPVPQAAGSASGFTAKPPNATPATASATSQPEADISSEEVSAASGKNTGQASAAASDQQETESAQSRQAKDAEQQRAADSESDKTDNAAAAKKAKPSAKAAALEKAPDPRHNRMLLLGERYLYGRGVPQNCNQALVYFKGAAEENNAPAMAHLGAMYASGQCVTLNRVTAFNWFAHAQNAQPSDPWLQRNMNMLWRDMTPQERTAINK